MREKLAPFDVVIFVRDIPEEGITAGTAGTVIDDEFDDGFLMVEIADEDGVTLALPIVSPEDLIRADASG